MLTNSKSSPDVALMIQALRGATDAANEAAGVPKDTREKLIDSNIVTKTADVSPTLRGNEKPRAYNFGLELARALYDFAQKHKEDTKEKTLIQSQAKDVKEATADKTPETKLNKDKLGFWATLLVATIVIANLIWEKLGPLGASISKFVIKLPQMLRDFGVFQKIFKMLSETKFGKIIGELFKPLSESIKIVKEFFGIGATTVGAVAKSTGQLKNFAGILKSTTGLIGRTLGKLLRPLPFISGVLGMVYAYKRFKEGQWFRGTIELVSALLTFSVIGLPISMILDGALLVYDLMEGKGYSQTATTSTAGKISIASARTFIPLLIKAGTKIGAKLGKVLKFVPLIGGLFHFTSAYMRLKDGHWFKGILEIIAGVASISGVFEPISWVISGALVISDLLETKVGVGLATTDAMKGVSIGAKLITPLLTKIGTKIGMQLLKVVKWIPVIGGLVNFASAYIRFKIGGLGEIIAGIFELIAGIAQFLPQFGGTFIAYAINGALILYDLLKSDKKEEANVPQGKNQKGVLSKIGDWIGAKIMTALWYTPGISGVLYLGRGISKMAGGDFIGGLKDMARAIVGTIGGKGLVDLISYALGFFESADKKTAPEEIKSKTFSITGIITGLINGFIQSIVSTITDILNWAKSIPEKISSTMETAKDNAIMVLEANGKLEEALKLKADSEKGLEVVRQARQRLISDEDYAKLSVADKRSISKQAAEMVKTGSTLPEGAVQPTTLSQQAQAAATSTTLPVQPINVEVTSEQPTSIAPALKSDFSAFDITAQNDLIITQNGILMELLNTAKQQLNILRKPSAPVVVTGGDTSASSVNMDTAFSTTKQDSRGMLYSSPYSLISNPA